MEDNFGVDSQTAEADMFTGMPGMGQPAAPTNQGIAGLEKALAADAMPGPSNYGSNAVTNPAANMAPGGQSIMPGTPQVQKPFTVDETQMKQAGGDINQLSQGQGGGNSAARIGNLAGGLLDLYTQSQTGFSFR